MSFSSSTAATVVFQQVLHNAKSSRRLLLNTPLHQQQAAAATTPQLSDNTYGASEPFSGDNSLDGNVVMIISILLCALICVLGLNSIVRCTLRRLQSSEPSASSTVSLPSTGVNKKALKTFPIVNYSTDLKLPGLDAECVICLSEFAPGERVKVLPKCNHGFHVRCIDRWLASHSSCPTCRNCLIQTCQKIVGCSIPANTSQPILLPQESINVTVAPLEAEGIVLTYQT